MNRCAPRSAGKQTRLESGDGRPQAIRPTPAHALSAEERQRILELTNEPQFAEPPPAQIMPTPTDEGTYIASEPGAAPLEDRTDWSSQLFTDTTLGGQPRSESEMTTRLSAGRVRKIYQFIRENRSEHSVETMCQLLEVSRSGHYAWLAKPMSDRAREDARLLRLILASFKATHGIYGAPRIFLDLREAGEGCSKHRVIGWSDQRSSKSSFWMSF